MDITNNTATALFSAATSVLAAMSTMGESTSSVNGITTQQNKRKRVYVSQTANKERRQQKQKQSQQNERGRFIQSTSVVDESQTTTDEDDLFKKFVLSSEQISAANSVRSLVHKVNKHIEINQYAVLPNVNHQRKMSTRKSTNPPQVQRLPKWAINLCI